MLAGESDIAMASEWVLTGAALTHDQVRTFASIDKFQHVYILGRTDRGLRNVSDLKGKAIGLQFRTNAEFYLGLYLNLNGMEIHDVTIVDVPAPQLADALANGTVDAVIVWQPYVARITDRMPTGLVVWPAQSGQVAFEAVITTDAWLSVQREPARQFLAALARAETDTAQDSGAAKAITGGAERRQRLSGCDLARAPVRALPRPVARRRHGGRGPVDDREQPDERDGDPRLRDVHRPDRPRAGPAGRGEHPVTGGP